MNDLETCDFNTVNLERLAFYFEKFGTMSRKRAHKIDKF